MRGKYVGFRRDSSSRRLVYILIDVYNMATKAMATTPAAPKALSAGAAPVKLVGTGGEPDLVGTTPLVPTGADAVRVTLVPDGLRVVRVELWLT